MRPIEVAIQCLAHGEGLELPAYATAQSAGLDLSAAVTGDVVLKPGARALIPAGFNLALPPGFEAQIRPRSGLALEHGITVLNAPGTIDSDYRGEIGVLLVNLGEAPFTVSRGRRIAQLVIAPVSRVELRPARELALTARGEGGFGSTGEAALTVARGGKS